jgi:hypothetical protein
MTETDNSSVKQVKQLLREGSKIVKRQREISILKGENFNLFSVLKFERKENRTHSAFIGEVLNPKGSHMMGTVFLDLFLSEIGYDEHITRQNKSANQSGKKDKIDSSKSSARTEFYIGVRDDKLQTGGRIDIYISVDTPIIRTGIIQI